MFNRSRVCSIFLLVVNSLIATGLLNAFEVKTVKNFRPVFPKDPSCRFFRAAAFDELSEDDARLLLDKLGADLTVIDLRNQDEIETQKRSPGSLFFYQQIKNKYHIPILININAFWDEAISRLDGPTRLKATLQSITKAGALDRAAARALEDNGLSMLYTILLATASDPLSQTLSVCASAAGSVVFHCQKGKDRTGIVAMLLQYCRENPISDQEIIQHYAKSGELLGEIPASTITEKKSTGAMLDWSKFRGSPALAMEDTLQWIRRRYGSIQGYIINVLNLDSATLQKLSE